MQDPRTSSVTRLEMLILGAGWTSSFIISLLDSRNVSYVATSTSGREGTIPFKFDPDSSSLEPYATLPAATTILITFPLRGKGQAARLVDCYSRAHESLPTPPHWIQFGSTSIFTAPAWNSHTSSYATDNPRAIAEDELLHLGHSTILNLAGLYGDKRQPVNWLSRVAKSKADAKAKGALHLIHGADVARAVLGAMDSWENVVGKRWIIADLHVYDWWDVMYELGPASGEMLEGVGWREAVVGFMAEEGVRALPRDVGGLGRVLDARDFWKEIGLVPEQGREWLRN